MPQGKEGVPIDTLELTPPCSHRPIAMSITQSDLKPDLDALTSQQLQQVADFIAFLQFRDCPRRPIDPIQFAAIAEFVDNDRAMAEAGMGDYATLLAQED
jgi:hypothetical protein